MTVSDGSQAVRSFSMRSGTNFLNAAFIFASSDFAALYLEEHTECDQ